MKVISFYLKGKMAHFRRFYSNSSSLTYSIPPRTTLAGIIAGLLGWERDSYYDLFSLQSCRLAVAAATPIKKSVQTLNLLKVESVNELNASSGFHTQTATEFIFPFNIRSGCVTYQVWFHHENADIMEQLENLLDQKGPTYGSRGIALALGTAYNLGWIEYAGALKGEEYAAGKYYEVIHSAMPRENLANISLKDMVKNEYRLVREELPLEFDQNRSITAHSLRNMIFDMNGNPIPAEVTRYIRLDNRQCITWME